MDIPFVFLSLNDNIRKRRNPISCIFYTLNSSELYLSQGGSNVRGSFSIFAPTRVQDIEASGLVIPQSFLPAFCANSKGSEKC